MKPAKDGLYVGVDMGGTDIKATVTDGAGDLLVHACDKISSHASEGPRQTVEQLALAADKILARAGRRFEDVVSVGLCTPGPASLDGVLARSPNLNHPGWEGFSIRQAFEARLGRPVIYANDGNAAGYWEYFRLYQDDPAKILAAVTLGTGLGGALVWGGDSLAGSRGFGAEFGHIRLPTHEIVTDGDVPVCGCGKTACAEAFCSVTALDVFLRKALKRPEHANHALQRIPDLGKDRALRLLGLADEGDNLALELFDRQAAALGLLFVQLANAFDPDIIVIGGGLTESSEAFRNRYMQGVNSVFRREAFPKVAQEAIIEFAGDQDLAGACGVALLARQHAQRTGLTQRS